MNASKCSYKIFSKAGRHSFHSILFQFTFVIFKLTVAADRLPPIPLWGGGMLRTAAQATSITLRLV